MIRLITIFLSGKVISQVINFLTIILLMSYLTVSEFGKYNLIIEVFIFFITIIEISSRSIYIRELTKKTFKMREIVNNTLVVSSISILVFFIFIYFYNIENKILIFFIYVIALLSSSVLPYLSLLISRAKAKNVVYYEIQISLLKFISIFFVLFNEYNFYYLYTFYFINIFVFYFFYKRFYKHFILCSKRFSFSNFYKSKLLTHVKPMFFVAFVSIAYNKIDIFMIGYFLSTFEIGEYSAIYKLILPFLFISSSVYLVLLPKFSQTSFSLTNIQKFSFYMFLIGLSLSIILCLLFYFYINYFNQKYEHLFSGFVVYSFYLPLVFSYGVITNFFVSERKEYLLLKVLSFYLILNIILNFIFINKYGMYGAIYSTIICELLIFINYFFMIIKYKGDRVQ